MPRLPRKLKTSIMNEGAASVAIGWGVHIDEGINYKVFFWINFILVLLSGLIAAVWAKDKGDFQGAMGFSCWVIAVGNTLLFAGVYRYRQM
jgi:hypothetical protein